MRRPTAAARRGQRPHLRLRPRVADADPGQGPGADGAVGVVVRAVVRRGAAPPDLGRRPGDPGRVARPGDARTPAGDAAGRVRGPRLPDRQRAGVVPGGRCGLGRPAAGRAGGRVAAAGAGLHSDDQGTGRRPRRGDDLPAGRGGGRAGTGGEAAGADPRRLPAGGPDCGRPRHPAGRHQAGVRRGRRGRAGARGRGAHARLVALVAGRPLAAGRPQPSYDKQFVRDWLSAHWDRQGEPPPLPAEIVEQTRARYIEAYERITGSSFADWPG
jgi:Phosphoribosylaminoimidazolesuccinocarboxamide (SAICAR) synthase